MNKIPAYNFTVRDNHYIMNYFLTDGIYSCWATLMKDVYKKTMAKAEKLFTKRHEPTCKDVERAFGVI